MRRFALFFIASFLLVIPAHAQDGYPLPANLPLITPNNAAQLTQLASIGGTLPDGLAWSPDGVHLAVGTSAGLQIFDSANLDAKPFSISGPDISRNYYFDSRGHLVVSKDKGQEKWDVQTGQLFPPTPQSTTTPPATHHYVSSDGNVEAVPDFQYGQIIIHLADPRVTPAKKLDDLNTGLDADFSNMTFSPNGRKLVIQANHRSTDGDVYPAPIIQLWDVSSRTLIKKWPIPYSQIDELVFSADSHLLGVVESDGTWDSEVTDGELQIWNTATGELFDRMDIYEPSDYVTTSNGRFAVRHNEDMVLWTGQDFIHLPASGCPGENENNALLRFSPSGNSLFTDVNCGEQIQVWDVTGKIDPNQPSVMLDSDNLITWVVFSPDEKRVVTNEKNFVARIWDAQSGATLFDIEGEAQGVSFSTDGTLLGGFDGKGNRVLWDASTGKQIITLLPSTYLNADWSQAAYWLDKTSVRVIETGSGKSVDLKIFDAYIGDLSAFNGDAGKVFFTGDDVRGYDLESGAVFIQRPNSTEFSHIVFSPGGKYFLSYTTSSDAVLITTWETAHPAQPLHHFVIPEARDFAHDFVLSADGKLLSDLDKACYANGGNYRLWDTTNGKLLVNFENDAFCGPYSTSFSPDGKWVIVGWSNRVDILNIAEAIEAAETDENAALATSHTSFFTSFDDHMDNIAVQVSPDGEQLVVTMKFSDWKDGTLDSPIVSYGIGIFNFQDLIGKSGIFDKDVEKHIDIPNARIGYDAFGKYNVGQVKFSSDSRYMLTDSGLYDAETGDLLAPIASTTIAFSPDSKTLVTAGSDSVQVWDVAALAQGKAIPLATFDVQSVQEVVFNPDGKTLYVRGVNDVQVWGIPPAS
ncbi:MAG: WD40 repeat domain-containing protein [Chloroflexota bacterium]